MRNNIFNVVLEFGDVKETTTEGDNTSIVTDKAQHIKVAEIIRQFIAICRVLSRAERTEYVSDFLLLLRFSCCLPINCLLLLNVYIYIYVCVCVCVYVYIFIIKFGYNARCHWLKERAL